MVAVDKSTLRLYGGRRRGLVLFYFKGIFMVLEITVDPAQFVECRIHGDDRQWEV